MLRPCMIVTNEYTHPPPGRQELVPGSETQKVYAQVPTAHTGAVAAERGQLDKFGRCTPQYFSSDIFSTKVGKLSKDQMD